MRILLVGDYSSIHIYNYFKNVISHIGCECVGYHIVEDDINPNYLKYYRERNIQIINGIDTSIYREQGAFKFTKQTCEKLSLLGEFDIIHLHAVRLFMCPALFLSRKLYKRIIITYWGSDLYRSTNLQLIKSLPLVHVSNTITMITEDMYTYFKNLPRYISRYSNKIRVCDFGNMLYDRIINYTINIDRYKKELGFEVDKLICTIGYVGRPQMQQLQTIKTLLQLLIKNKNTIQLAIPAYGIQDSDLQSIQDLLNSVGIAYQIFTDFMDEETVSKLRVISDIFIHAQTSDALSCAMLEHLYAGSIVINGEWLKYSILDNNGIYYKTFKDFSLLSEVLDEVICNIAAEKLKVSNNRDLVSQISSWDYLRKYWIDLYKE